MPYLPIRRLIGTCNLELKSYTCTLPHQKGQKQKEKKKEGKKIKTKERKVGKVFRSIQYWLVNKEGPTRAILLVSSIKEQIN